MQCSEKRAAYRRYVETARRQPEGRDSMRALVVCGVWWMVDGEVVGGGGWVVVGGGWAVHGGP